ncbi:MAG TPA: gephyrin-like molybdotransferase Glp [Hanamia sp.]
MISVVEAKKIIWENVAPLPLQNISLEKTAGYVLAKDIFSPIHLPPFPQSSMDGYAFSFSDWQTNEKLKISGSIPAGSQNNDELKPGSAVRIFTGAAVPPGADTVVMQEKTFVENDALIICDENIKQGMNVRPAGLEIKPNVFALKKDTFINPASIGFLASMGINEVPVYPKPSVTIIITGDELKEPGSTLLHGQIYESNSYTLVAALEQLRIAPVYVLRVKDDLALLTGSLKESLLKSDVILLTGGISVGDYDFVLQATINNNIQKLFHRIKQKPGKPLYFGKLEDKYVFGLPGNPASSLTCFYEYVAPALGKLCNRDLSLKKLRVPIMQDFKKPAGLTYFLKGYYDDMGVHIFEAQESFRLSSFSTANCLVQIDEEITECKKGELIEIHLLPE